MLRIVKEFSSDIGIKFGLDNLVPLAWRKVVTSRKIRYTKREKCIKLYKYLGVKQAPRIVHQQLRIEVNS